MPCPVSNRPPACCCTAAPLQARGGGEIDSKQFQKLLRDSGVIVAPAAPGGDAGVPLLTTTTADLAFTKSRPQVWRRLALHYCVCCCCCASHRSGAPSHH